TSFSRDWSSDVCSCDLVVFVSLFSVSVYKELPKHQQERIMVLFEGEGKYRDTSGYNLLYSKTAIGSGDFFGKGYLQGTVKIGKLDRKSVVSAKNVILWC